MSSHEKLCRTCESREGALVSIFDNFEPRKSFADALTACAPVEVSKTDKLPKHICLKCMSSLIAAYNFQRQCIEVNHKLLNLVQNSKNINIKLEPQEESFKDEGDGDDLFQDFISDIGFPKKLESKNEIILSGATEVKVELNDIENLIESRNTFKCHTCNVSHQDKIVLDKHIAKDECRKHKCKECGKKFSRENSLSKHLKRKHDPNNKEYSKGELLAVYACHVCGARFKRKSRLEDHILTYNHSNQCLDCGSIFPKLSELKRHQKTHRDENATTIKKAHICPHCGKGFRQTSNLREHVNIHTHEKEFLCYECGRGFSCKSNLRQHLLRHTGEKPFACHLCTKKFSFKAPMQRHVESHSGERPHMCDTCGKSYATRWTLKKHEIIHSGAPRPHECDVCAYKFSKRDHLKRHYRIHTGEKPFICTVCKRAFAQSNDLVKHMAVHLGHPDVYQCDRCPQRFRLKADLSKHAITHYLNADGGDSRVSSAAYQQRASDSAEDAPDLREGEKETRE